MSYREYYPHLRPTWETEARLAWLSQSGPRYEEVNCTYQYMLDDSAYVVRSGDAVSKPIFRDAMSYASWLMCLGADRGDDLTLKVRCDPVGMAR